ncbi:glycosyltransferase family 25 protein [Oceanicola sp. S124]|uniref:glycosyltransferase family 25 protein n=1 Tax=Oceanicola sp. S124 TaxID=1042378 RepID=UPI0002558116|nr:glycosyltransferase family 25 protein [Oceanicola sp. S124]
MCDDQYLLAHVINLDSAGDRLAHMAASLDRLDLAHRRQPACTPQEVPRASAALGLRFGARLRPLERACFLSHARAWQEIATGPAHWGLVLEDDAIFARDAAAGIHFAARDSEAELVRIETLDNTSPRIRLRPDVRGGDEAAGFALHRLLGRTIAAGAYMLHRQAAGRLLAELRGMAEISLAVDEYLFLDPAICPLRQQHLWPAVSIQSSVLAEVPRSELPPAWATTGLPLFASSMRHEEEAPERKFRVRKSVGHSLRRWLTGHRRRPCPLSPAGPLLLPAGMGDAGPATTLARLAASAPDRQSAAHPGDV